MADTHKYSPDIVISPYTNRPANGPVVETGTPVYWCPVCCKRLSTVTSAYQHVCGQVHRKKIQHLNAEGRNLKQTRKVQETNLSNDSAVKEPDFKKKKAEPLKSKVSDPNLTCVDCNLVFDSLHDTIQHFKYTKHDSKEVNAADNKLASNTVVTKTNKQSGTDTEIKCDVCNIVFRQSSTADEHYKGKRHAKAVRAMEAAKEREILDNWQTRRPTVLSNKKGGNQGIPGRGFPKSIGSQRGNQGVPSIGSQQSKVIPGFVRASGACSNGSQGAYSTLPSSGLPVSSNNRLNADVGVNMADESRHNSMKYRSMPNDDMQQNSTYGPPASSSYQAHSYTNTYPMQSRETQDQMNGYQAPREYLSRNTAPSSIDRFEHSNYEYYNNDTSNTPNRQYSSNNYYDHQSPADASYSNPRGYVYQPGGDSYQ